MINMNNDFYLKIEMGLEEWNSYSQKEKKSYLNRLALIDVWLAKTILEYLQSYEKEIELENRISFKNTYDYYYQSEE